MKKLLLTTICVIVSLQMFATVLTVNSYGGAQHTSIDDAINAASSGDTIYIHGIPTYYCIPGVVKNNLTFIGPGFNPSKQNALAAVITCGNWTVGDNTTLIGLSIQGLSGNPNYTNLTVKRCYIWSGPTGGCPYYSNVIFEDCIFNGANPFYQNGNCPSGATVYSSIFRNCLFYANYFGNTGLVLNTLVDHCVFVGGGGNILSGGTSTSSSISFTNNIFYNAYATVAGASGIVYNNNFSNVENLNLNAGSGNIQGANPMFVNSSCCTFSYALDYHLTTNSPCIGTGTSGSDMGIYSGVAPFLWEGHPPIPQMDYFNIIGTQAPQNGSINVTFQSTIKN